MDLRRKTKRRASKYHVVYSRGPRAVRHVRYLGTLSITAFAAVIILMFVAAGFHQRLMGRANVAAVVSAVLVDLTNNDRAAQGLSTLQVSATLVAAAQAKADDMAAHSYFAHTSPTGVDPWHWFAVAGYTFDYAGENLAVDFSDSGDVNNAWMNSPTHRENILDPHYTEIGIATAQGYYQGQPTTFVVQEFGKPSQGVQKAVAVANVPKAPTTIATATTKSDTGPQVLGTAVKEKPTPVTSQKTLAVSREQLVASSTETTITASVIPIGKESVHNPSTPLWGYLVSFPHSAMRYFFYAVAALILLALALETELELHWRHRMHALRAGMLLGVMAILFVVANAAFFGSPIIATAPTDSQSASVAAALR